MQDFGRDPGGTARAIVVIGVSGSGKTTIGTGLAAARGAVFLEGDAFHSPGNIAKMAAGTPLDDADRWPWLDAIGQAIADEWRHGHPVVVACSALKRAYRERLSTRAGGPLRFILLTADPGWIEERMRGRRHFMPPSLLGSQRATLEPLGADESGTAVAQTGSPADTIAAIQAWIGC